MEWKKYMIRVSFCKQKVYKTYFFFLNDRIQNSTSKRIEMKNNENVQQQCKTLFSNLNFTCNQFFFQFDILRLKRQNQ